MMEDPQTLVGFHEPLHAIGKGSSGWAIGRRQRNRQGSPIMNILKAGLGDRHAETMLQAFPKGTDHGPLFLQRTTAW